MSGQRQTRVPRGAGYSAAPTTEAAASVRTNIPTQTVAARHRGNDGLAQLGSVMGSFFNNAGQIAEKLDDIEHRDTVEGIKRQNEVLETEALADAAKGSQMNPEKAERWSYYATFQRASGQLNSQVDMNAWEEIVRKAPTDGSFDYDKQFNEWMRVQAGNGTGEAQHDAAYFANLKRQSEVLRGSFKDQEWRTVLGNQHSDFVASVSSLMQRQQGVTSTDIDEVYVSALQLTGGNKDMAQRLVFTGITETLDNPQEAEAVLMSLGDSKLGQEHPEFYQRLSEKAWSNLTQVRSVEAGKSLFGLRRTLTNLAVNPNAGPEDYDKFFTAVSDSMRRYGAVDDHEGLWGQAIGNLQQQFKKQADTNLWVELVQKGQGYETALAARGMGKSEFLSKHFTTGFNALLSASIVEGSELSKNLTADGGVDLTASAGSAREAAQFIARPDVARASPQPVPDGWREKLSADLLGTDPARMANTFYLVQEVERLNGPHRAMELLQGDDAKRRYQALRSENGRLTPEEYAQRVQQAPEMDKYLSSLRTGSLNWAEVLGESKTASEVQVGINDKIRTGLREAHGLNAWFFGPQSSIGGTDVRLADETLNQDMQAGVLARVLEQKRLGGRPDVDAAIAAEVELWKNRTVAVPGLSGAIVYRDPYANTKRGSAYDHPITTINGRNVYRAGVVTDATGKAVDTTTLFRKDAEALTRLFPDMHLDADEMAFGAPGSGGADGLFRVMRKDGSALTLQLGVSHRLRPGTAGNFVQRFLGIDTTHPELRLPTDPNEAAKLLNQMLGGTGWFVENSGPMGPTGAKTVRLVYGPRVEKDEAFLKDELEKKRKNYEAFKAAGAAVPPPAAFSSPSQ